MVALLSSAAMEMLRLPLLSLSRLRIELGARYLGLLSLSWRPGAESPPPIQDPGKPVRSSSGLFPRRQEALKSFPGDPAATLPCSSTPGGPPRQTMAALRCCPRYHTHEDSPVHLSFEALSHGFAARCLRLKASFLNRQPRLASGGGSDLSGRDGSRRVSIEAF